MKHTAPLKSETFYHVFNRGINGESIFKHPDNYNYFLLKFDQHITPVADTYAYCLLNNHFHFLIRTRSDKEIKENLKSPQSLNRTTPQAISLQFSHFFNGYTQAINKRNGRTGKLFELPFRRIEVSNDSYFSRLIHYIHANPQRHGLISGFRDYPYSSYHSHLSDKPTRLSRKQVIAWFGDKQDFKRYHDQNHDERTIRPVLFED